MKKKQLLVYLLVFSLILPNFSSHFTSSVEADEISIPDIIELEDTYVQDEETGYISLPIDNDPYPETDSVISNSALKSSLPSSYHPYSYVASNYPATRNQSPYGTCWAFAAVACAEFDLITEGIFLNNLVSDFSELQLIYNMYHTGNDLLGNLSGDTITLASGTNYLNLGGNIYYGQHILANWRGLTDEDNIPYSSAASVYSSGSAPSSWSTWNNMARLENSRILDIKSNPSSVKEAIQEHGAVSASYCHDSTYYNLKNGYALYYCPTAKTANHAVAIVGWNDNFPSSYWSGCSYQPTQNGAWLIRNSWTTTTGGSEYSYFWMSYQDASLSSAVYMLDFASGDNIRVTSYNYDSIYQYDGIPIHSGIPANKIANVFTARNYYASSKGSKAETLEAVMIPFTHSSSVPLKIEVYTGITDSSNPESGQLHSEAITYYTTDYKGIYTFKLKNPVLLAPGETYSIVVTATNGASYFDLESSTTFFDCVTTKASVKNGQSFYYSNGRWSDAVNMASNGYGNLCVKGLTKNSSTAKYTITYQLNGGTKTASYPSGYSENDSSFALPTPERSGYHFLGWYTDSGFTQKITSISGSMRKNLVLYAKWGAHSYTEQITMATLQNDGISHMVCSCGTVASTSTIYRPQSLNLAYTTTEYTGSGQTPAVTVTDINGNTISSSYYTVAYSNNINIGTATVAVTFKGRYSGTMLGTFNIIQRTFTKVKLAYSSHAYTGKALKPSVTVYMGTKKLANKYYNVSYQNNKNAGTATVTIKGKGTYANYKTVKTFTINPKKFKKVTTKSSTFSYTGKAVKPSVSVYVGNKKISRNYYSLSYKNNVNIGTATITVTGKGKYKNYKSSKTFIIVPKKQVVKSVSTNSTKGYLYCTHTYDSLASGYQVQVSSSKSFKNNASNTFGNTFTVWYINGLASKKTYYVRVRSYCYINGKKYYGAWSKVKSKKTL